MLIPPMPTSMTLLGFPLTFLLIWVPATWGDVVTAWQDEYRHAIHRDKLVAETAASERMDRRESMSDKEQVVDQYLQVLRNELYHEASHDNYPAAIHCAKTVQEIRSTTLYDILKQMPKGGNLHVHENHQLDRVRLLTIIWESDTFEHLYILPENHTSNPWMMDFFLYPPDDEPWIKVKNNPTYTNENIFRHTTLVNLPEEDRKCLENQSRNRWKVANPVWGKMRQVIRHRDIKEKYIRAMLEESMEHGIQYIETRKGLADKLYLLDPDARDTFGKKYLSVEEDIKVGISVVKTFKQEHPEFVGFKRIGQSYRSSDIAKSMEDLDHVMKMHEKYPHHVIGYDLIAEEDGGNSLLYHLDNLIRARQFHIEHPDFKLFLHAAETNFPEDVLMTKNRHDPVSALENAYDALLLHPVRVGHGLGFVKHPHLVETMRELDIAVEVCAVSNSVFGYICDVRMHPSLHYLRAGVPLVIASDAEGTSGTDVTMEWHLLFMAWGLSLYEMKQMANNSLTYTGLTAVEKQEALKSWSQEWDHFINQVHLIICSGLIDETSPSFNKIFPKAAPSLAQTTVHVYGRHFEIGICNQIICKFGRKMTVQGKYISYSHISCDLPPTQKDRTKICDSVSCSTEHAEDRNENIWAFGDHFIPENVNIFISFDGGKIFHDTRKEFVFMNMELST